MTDATEYSEEAKKRLINGPFGRALAQAHLKATAHRRWSSNFGQEAPRRVEPPLPSDARRSTIGLRAELSREKGGSRRDD